MSDGLSVHCVDTTDVVAVDTAHTKDVLSADATDFMSAHTTLTFPRKSNILAPELFVLNFSIFWSSLEAFFSRISPTNVQKTRFLTCPKSKNSFFKN